MAYMINHKSRDGWETLAAGASVAPSQKSRSQKSRSHYFPDTIQPRSGDGWVVILSDDLYDQPQAPGQAGNTCRGGRCGVRYL